MKELFQDGIFCLSKIGVYLSRALLWTEGVLAFCLIPFAGFIIGFPIRFLLHTTLSIFGDNNFADMFYGYHRNYSGSGNLDIEFYGYWTDIIRIMVFALVLWVILTLTLTTILGVICRINGSYLSIEIEASEKMADERIRRLEENGEVCVLD